MLSPNRLPRQGRRARLREIGSSEAGFTLPELLMVTMLTVLVLGLLMQPLITSPKVANRDIHRDFAIQDIQTSVYKMTRELRQAWQIYSANGTSIDAAITSAGVANRVLYKCDTQPAGSPYRQCTRTTAACNQSTSPPTCNQAPSSSGGTVVVARLLNGTTADPNDPVFTFTPTCTTTYSGTLTYICVKVNLPSSAGYGGGYRNGYQYQVAVSDGVYLRNMGTQ